MVDTPASSETDDDNESFEYRIDDQFYARETDILNRFKEFLDETDFGGRCESTLLYISLKEKSRSNLRNRIKRIFYIFLNVLHLMTLKKYEMMF